MERRDLCRPLATRGFHERRSISQCRHGEYIQCAEPSRCRDFVAVVVTATATTACLLLRRHKRPTEPTVVGEDMHRLSYHQNDHGTRASYLYDGDDKTHGATAAPSTDEEYLNSHATQQQRRTNAHACKLSTRKAGPGEREQAAGERRGGANEEMKEAKTITRRRRDGRGELVIQRRGRPRSVLVLKEGGRGSSFYTARSVMSRLGFLSFFFFFFGVAGVLYNCTITHGQLCFVWAGEGRRGGSGGSIDLRSFLHLVLYRSVVGKRRYHGAMGCEEEGGGGLWIGRTMPTQGTSVPCHLDINQFRRLTNVFIMSIWCALRI